MEISRSTDSSSEFTFCRTLACVQKMKGIRQPTVALKLKSINQKLLTWAALEQYLAGCSYSSFP